MNGRILGYKLYYSTAKSGDDFREILYPEGSWTNNADKKEVIFQPVLARKLQLRATATGGDTANTFISAAEFYVYEIMKEMPE